MSLSISLLIFYLTNTVTMGTESSFVIEKIYILSLDFKISLDEDI